MENIDRALYPVLAAEFQGFCRDLHGEAVTAIIAETPWPTEQIARVSAAAMQVKRGLDRKNPASSGIGDDFRALSGQDILGGDRHAAALAAEGN